MEWNSRGEDLITGCFMKKKKSKEHTIQKKKCVTLYLFEPDMAKQEPTETKGYIIHRIMIN